MEMTTKEGKRTIRRCQFPITAAYSLTDYRSQGQMTPLVLVDTAPPPSGTLSLFNLYVALSWSSGRDTVVLLRDFGDEMLKKSHGPELLEEDERFNQLDMVAEGWYKQVVLKVQKRYGLEFINIICSSRKNLKFTF